MAFKDWAAKRLLGFDQQELTQRLGSLVEANLYQWLGKDIQVSISDNFDYIINGYMSVPYAYEAITMIVNKIAASPALIYEVVSESKLRQYNNLKWSDSPATRIKAAQLKANALVETDKGGAEKIRKLLDTPNPKQTYDEFIRLLSVLLLGTGNALAYGVSGDARTKKLSEIWALPFNPLQYKIISEGIFEPVSAYRVDYNAGNSKLDFPASDIAHFKTVNPLWETSAGQLYGMSPLHAYRAKLMRSKLGDQAANKLLANGFRMGLISPRHKEDAWQAEQAKGVKEAIQRALHSNDAYSRFIPSSHAIDFTPVGLDSAELGVNELDKLDRESVYRAYQINPLLASTDKSSYNNLREVRKAFIHDAVAPICELIGDVLTNFICPPFDKADNKKYVIKLDYMSLPELGADMKEMVEWLDKSPVTSNEYREMMGFGRSEEPGADSILINKGKVTLEQVVDGSALGSSGSDGSNSGNVGAN